MTGDDIGATQTIVTAQVPRNWLREAISDGDGLADMAYISIGSLTVTAIVALVFILFMSAYDYGTCQPVTVVSKGDTSVASVVPCRYDPLPTGQSAGLIFAAFAGLIGSLAGYMVATLSSKVHKAAMNTATVLLLLFTVLACVFVVWLLIVIYPAIDRDKAKEQIDGTLARWGAYWKDKFKSEKQ